MCKISYAKCICFLFLVVILVVFISGSPIDDSRYKKMRLFRTRHRAQLRDLRTQNRIEATVFQNDEPPAPLTKRSPANRHRTRQECKNEHFSTKAFKSQIVLRVKVQGIERTNYTVSFKLIEKLKIPPSFPEHECLTLQFSNRTGNYCDRGRRNRKNLVKADIRASQEYVLFLNTNGNRCTPSYSPEWIPPRRRKHKDYIMRILKKVCNPKFKVKPTYIVKLEDKSTWKRSREKRKKKLKLKLTCRAAGLPFPRISWSRNNVTLVNSTNVSISYVKDEDWQEWRRSTLEIREPSQYDFGRYECVATTFNGSVISKSIEVHGPPVIPTSNPFSEPVFTKRECNETYTEAYCMGHGKCYTDYNDQVYCECADGYIGYRCDEKTTHPASTYPQNPYDACKLGLQTKYFCLRRSERS